MHDLNSKLLVSANLELMDVKSSFFYWGRSGAKVFHVVADIILNLTYIFPPLQY